MKFQHKLYKIIMFSDKMYFKKIIIILVLSFLILGAKAQQILTLNEALKIALANNYSIQLAKNDAEIAINSNYAGAAGMLPTVAATASQDNVVNNTQQKFLNGTENNKDGAKSNQLNAGIELGWTIFDGLKMFATKNKLSQLQDIGELRMRLQIEQNFSRLVRAYYDIIQNKKLLNAYQQSVKISTERLQQANDKFAVGKVSKTEVLKAQVDLNTDKSAQMKQQNLLQNAKINLNQILARELTTDFDVENEIILNKDLKLADLQSKAQSQNTNLLIVKKNLQINSFVINEIKAERMPTVQLKTGYNFNRQASEAGFLQSSQTNGYHYGAALSLNVFNGFSVDKRLQNAKLSLKSTDFVLKDSMSKLDLAIQQNYNSYALSLQLVQFETENVTVAQTNFELANEQYKVGVITAIELRDAQQNYLLSQTRLTAAQFDAKVAETELLRLSADIFKVLTN
ncbi:MAG: TolC family protein [Bacteroidia bacterium]|nr:TolC family protein [Bacteroidia bacterium]